MMSDDMAARLHELHTKMKAAQLRWKAVADRGGVSVAGGFVTENEAQIALGVLDCFLPMVERLIPATQETTAE